MLLVDVGFWSCKADGDEIDTVVGRVDVTCTDVSVSGAAAVVVELAAGFYFLSEYLGFLLAFGLTVEVVLWIVEVKIVVIEGGGALETEDVE